MPRVLAAVLSASLVLAAAGSAWGQPAAYPTRPIRFIVPQTPSGMVDNVARTVAQHLAERLAQPMIVENRAGASGRIAIDPARCVSDRSEILKHQRQVDAKRRRHRLRQYVNQVARIVFGG